MPSAHEQLFSEDPGLRLRSFDSVDLNLVGTDSTMLYLDAGVMGLDTGVATYRGRFFGLAKAAEFEQALYSYTQDGLKTIPLTPLIPRGFVEDVYNELSGVDGQDSVAFDQSLGSVMVFFGQESQSRGKPVHIRLIDSLGHEVQGGWFFGSEHGGLVRAIFFNLQPGGYGVVVENENRYWLGADTTIVDFWTTSFVQLGARIGPSKERRSQ
jgi:hypothetical protein